MNMTLFWVLSVFRSYYSYDVLLFCPLYIANSFANFTGICPSWSKQQGTKKGQRASLSRINFTQAELLQFVFMSFIDAKYLHTENFHQ